MHYPVIDLKATGDKIKELRLAQKMSIRDVCIYMGFENPSQFTSGNAVNVYQLLIICSL